MKPLMQALLLGLPLVVVGCGPSPDMGASSETAAVQPAASTEESEATIVQLEREWVAAIVSRDIPTINRLLAPNFVGTAPNAHSYSKEIAVMDLESGVYAVKSMDLTEVSANVYGDTAVSFSSQEEVSMYGGEDTSGHYHYTNVWLRRNGQWQVVASHGSRFEEPH